jgi:hypothetical protein
MISNITRENVENSLSDLHSPLEADVSDNTYSNTQIYELNHYTKVLVIHILDKYQVLNLRVTWLAFPYFLQSIRRPSEIHLLLASLGVALHWLGHTRNDDMLRHQEKLNIHILGKVSSSIK